MKVVAGTCKRLWQELDAYAVTTIALFGIFHLLG